MKRLVLFIAVACAFGAHAQEPMPLFDAHMHYNVETRSYLSPEQVIFLWRKTGIRAVLATSRPNDGTLDLISRIVRGSAYGRYCCFPLTHTPSDTPPIAVK